MTACDLSRVSAPGSAAAARYGKARELARRSVTSSRHIFAVTTLLLAAVLLGLIPISNRAVTAGNDREDK